MEKISKLPSTAIPLVLPPTFKAFTPLLLANKPTILSITPTTHCYGVHPRQTLDIYTPPSSSTTSSQPPILIFLYGGGLTRGDKILPAADRLIYHNLGTFFARHNFTTIIADYRRVNNPSAGTGEDAIYPSGGADLASVLSWLTETHLAHQDATAPPRDVFIMGNSAGGLHLATWLLDTHFEAQRRALVGAGTAGKARVRGVVLNSVPLDMADAAEGREAVNNEYWRPGETPLEEFCPVGLLKALVGRSKGVELGEVGLPPVLVLTGEFDPEDEILWPNGRFVEVWEGAWGKGKGLERRVMRGHNHISPPLALMSGEGEEWGEELVGWMNGLVKGES